jgi:4-oxalocrotonate tautomerase
VHQKGQAVPIIHVYLPKGETQDFKNAIARSIQDAMIETFALPEDDYFQITHETDPANLHYDRNYFGVKRGEKPVMISLSFNVRPPEPKKALFAAVVRNLTASPGIPIEDIYMNIIECAPENWWAYARTVNPETGTDARMGAPKADGLQRP